MAKPPPMKSYALHWWRRALDDGRLCENKRRERYFTQYAESAEIELTQAGLIPDGLDGPFRCLYRRGFRLGYDNAVLLRKRLPNFRKHAKLGK